MGGKVNRVGGRCEGEVRPGVKVTGMKTIDGSGVVFHCQVN